MEVQKVRIDKYLWAIRVFKTRSEAAEACNKGRVVCGDRKLKASYLVKTGETYEIKINADQKRKIEVSALLDRRMSAEKVKPYFSDHSPPPPELTDQLPSVFYEPQRNRKKGSGRPEKKEGRAIRKWFDL